MCSLLALTLCQQALIAAFQEKDLLRVWKAIIYVESRGDAYAVGDGGLAVGIGQLHPCYVDDANRILKRKVFSYSDRTNPEKSWAMFLICTKHYCPDGTPEQIAKVFHRGSKAERQRYWLRVKKVLQ